MAEETKSTIEFRVVQAREYTLNGVEGVWMPKEMANKLLSDIERLPLLEATIKDLSLILDIRTKRMENFKLGMETAERGRETAIKALQLSEIKLDEAKRRLNIWYRNPTLWFVVGAVVGVSIEAVIFVGVMK